ncbi:MAG: DUF1804 family protein [Thermodesulfobacteriota bacterium]|nr:DUF1804 family protein [Thermodesulfobacteriota bacterium]
MKDREEKQKQMRRLYAKGKTIKEIAATFGLKEKTIQAYKKKDKDAFARDWDLLRVEHRLSDEEIRENQRIFLSSLFTCFQEERESLKGIEDPGARLALLERYATNYYKLTAAAKHSEPTAEISGLVVRIMETLSRLAIREGLEQVARFFMDHMEDVRQAIKKDFP